MGKIDYQFMYDYYLLLNEDTISFDYFGNIKCDDHLSLNNEHASFIAYSILDKFSEGTIHTQNIPIEHEDRVNAEDVKNNPFILTAVLHNGLFYMRKQTFGYVFDNGQEEAFEYEVLFAGDNPFDEEWDKSLLQYLSRAIHAIDPERSEKIHVAFDAEIEKIIEECNQVEDYEEIIKIVDRAAAINMYYHQNSESKSALMIYYSIHMLLNFHFKAAFELKCELQWLLERGFLPEVEEEIVEVIETYESTLVVAVVDDHYDEFVDPSTDERMQYEIIANKMIQTFKIYSERYLNNLVSALLLDPPAYIEDGEWFRSIAMQVYDAYDLVQLRAEETEEKRQADEKKDAATPTVKLSASEVLEIIFHERYGKLNRPAILKQQDELLMTPFMYLVLLKDESVFDLYPTIPTVKPNIFGQDVEDLLNWNFEFKFTERFIEVYDYDVIRDSVNRIERLRRNIESYSRSSARAEKIGSFFGNSVLGSIGDALSAGASGEQWKLEEKLNGAEREYRALIEKYADKGAKRNVETLKLLFTLAQDIQALKDKSVNEKMKIEALESKISVAKSTASLDFGNPTIKAIVVELVKVEEGPKDEFETTKEYEARLEEACSKLIEKAKAAPNSLPQLVKVANQYSEELKKELIEMKTKFAPELNKVAFFDWLTEADHANEALVSRAYFGDVCVKLVQYDADNEKFSVTIKEQRYDLAVSRKVAKEFKESFNSLVKYKSYRATKKGYSSVVKVHFREEVYCVEL